VKNFEKVNVLQVGKSVRLRNSEKRGRYKYSGFLEPEKYNHKANNLDFASSFLLETLKSDRPCGRRWPHFTVVAKLLVIIYLAAIPAPSAGLVF
jgi:hypothetical protein